MRPMSSEPLVGSAPPTPWSRTQTRSAPSGASGVTWTREALASLAALEESSTDSPWQERSSRPRARLLPAGRSLLDIKRTSITSA